MQLLSCANFFCIFFEVTSGCFVVVMKDVGKIVETQWDCSNKKTRDERGFPFSGGQKGTTFELFYGGFYEN